MMKIPRSWCYNFVVHWYRREDPHEMVRGIRVRRKSDGSELYFCLDCWEAMVNTPFIREYEILQETEGHYEK